MPVAGEADNEAAGRGGEEMRLAFVVVVAYHVFLLAVLAVGRGRSVVEQIEALGALHHIHEVDFLAVRLRLAFLQRFVLAVFHRGPYVGARYHQLPLGYGEEVGLCEPFERRVPLRLVLVILRVELLQVHRFVGHGVEPVFPFSFRHPCRGFFLGNDFCPFGTDANRHCHNKRYDGKKSDIQ